MYIFNFKISITLVVIFIRGILFLFFFHNTINKRLSIINFQIITKKISKDKVNYLKKNVFEDL